MKILDVITKILTILAGLTIAVLLVFGTELTIVLYYQILCVCFIVFIVFLAIKALGGKNHE